MAMTGLWELIGATRSQYMYDFNIFRASECLVIVSYEYRAIFGRAASSLLFYDLVILMEAEQPANDL